MKGKTWVLEPDSKGAEDRAMPESCLVLDKASLRRKKGRVIIEPSDRAIMCVQLTRLVT